MKRLLVKAAWVLVSALALNMSAQAETKTLNEKDVPKPPSIQIPPSLQKKPKPTPAPAPAPVPAPVATPEPVSTPTSGFSGTAAPTKDAPKISPSLKKMLGALPIEGIKDDVLKMVNTLKKTQCANLNGCYSTKSGQLQLYFFTSSTAQQTFLLVINTKLALPKLLKENVQKILGGTSLSDLIISISTTDFDLDTVKMPTDLQKIVRDSYFNVNSLAFSSGVQLAGRADVGGAMKLTLKSMGVESDKMTLRAAVVMPIPTDLTSAAGAGAGLADSLAHSETMKKSGAKALAPEAFVELQLAPGATINMPGPTMFMTDATFFINNMGVFGYKGNVRFNGTKKDILLQFQTPLDPMDLQNPMNLLDFSFRMAMPQSFTLSDQANMILAMAMPDTGMLGPKATQSLNDLGGGFIGKINSFKKPLFAATKPLSVFQLRNPNPPAPYKFGDRTKPFPTTDAPFNVILLGPLAEGGPLMYVASDVQILGQPMGKMEVSAGKKGFHGMAEASIVLKMGPLGKTSVKMQALADISASEQDISLKGDLMGQKLAIILAGESLTIDLSASCVNPFEIKVKVAIEETMDIAKIFEGQAGANVDPSKLQNCMGKELEAAYNKIANEYKNTTGYAASAANAELKKISDAAAQAAAAAAKVAAAETVKIANKAAADAKDAADKATVAAKTANEKLTKASGDAQKRVDAVANEANKYNTDQVKNWVSAGVNSTGDQITGGLKKVGGAINKATCRLAGNCKKKKRDSQVCIAVYDEEFFLRGHPGISPDDAYNWWVNTLCKNGSHRGSAEFQVEEYQALNAARYGFPRENLFYPEELTAHWLSTGIKDGVQGSRLFNIQDYLAQNPELWNAMNNNWAGVMDHWLKSGINEGRAINAEFRATEYLANYADLRALLGDTNYPAAFDHWVLQGKAEGRKGRLDQAAIAQAATDVQAVKDAKTAADKATEAARVATESAQKLMYEAAWQSIDVFSAPEYYELNKARYGFVNPSDYAGLTQHWLTVGMKDVVKGSRLFDIQEYNGKNPGLWATVTPIGTWEGMWRHWADVKIASGNK
jgi:hypothetical protein